jgi:hypothetical protein
MLIADVTGPGSIARSVLVLPADTEFVARRGLAAKDAML